MNKETDSNGEVIGYGARDSQGGKILVKKFPGKLNQNGATKADSNAVGLPGSGQVRGANMDGNLEVKKKMSDSKRIEELMRGKQGKDYILDDDSSDSLETMTDEEIKNYYESNKGNDRVKD